MQITIALLPFFLSAVSASIKCEDLQNPESLAALNCPYTPRATGTTAPAQTAPVKRAVSAPSPASKPRTSSLPVKTASVQTTLNATSAGPNCSCPISSDEKKLSSAEKRSLAQLRSLVMLKLLNFEPKVWSGNGKNKFISVIIYLNDLQKMSNAKEVLVSAFRDKKPVHANNLVEEVLAEGVKESEKDSLTAEQFANIFNVQLNSIDSYPKELFKRLAFFSSSKFLEILEPARKSFIDGKTPKNFYLNPAREQEFIAGLKLDASHSENVRAALHFYSIVHAFFTKKITFEQAQMDIADSIPVGTVQQTTAATTQLAAQTSNGPQQTGTGQATQQQVPAAKQSTSQPANGIQNVTTSTAPQQPAASTQTKTQTPAAQTASTAPKSLTTMQQQAATSQQTANTAESSTQTPAAASKPVVQPVASAQNNAQSTSQPHVTQSASVNVDMEVDLVRMENEAALLKRISDEFALRLNAARNPKH